MLPKLPNNVTLKKAIETKKVRGSLDFVNARRQALKPYRSLEDLFVDPPNPFPKDLEGMENHLGNICWQFRKTLYTYSVFIGSSVLDQIVYEKLRDASVNDPIGDALALIRAAGIHKPGLVLYPLHSFGLLSVGLFEKLTPYRFELFVDPGEMCVRGQTNSLKETIRFIERASEGMGINRRVPVDSMEHYSRSRPTKWLTKNPLLVLKVRSFSGTYYENQRFLMLHLERACSFLFMLASLQHGFPVKKEEHLFSSGRANNWETLDIYHFILFEPEAKTRNRFDSVCVPMNYASVELAELSSVNVDINLKAWAHRRPVVERICDALAAVESGYLRTNILSDGDSVKGRVYRKIMQSLRYFRRSFRLSSGDDDIVMLTIALEVLLTDSYAPEIGKRFRERCAILLSGYSRRKECLEQIERIYDARNQVVHTGVQTTEVDLPTVQEAYTMCILALIGRIPGLPHLSADPVARLVFAT